MTRTTLLFCLACSLLCTSCATTSQVSRNAETSDLGVVVADAFQISESVGRSRVLVVFDIDNTLMAMEQGLGSDQWYEWQKDLAENDRCNDRLVTDRLAAQGALYFASAMRPTQTDAPELVRQLQDAGFSVIALTSRGVDFRLQTFRELRRNGLDLRRTAIGPDGGWPEDFLPDNGIRPVRYEDGVFLTTGQHKGEMLLELLRRTGSEIPGAVIMADDKQSNLDAVSEALARFGIVARTWRYAGEDGNVESFDAERSDDQWQRLKPALETIQEVLGPDHYQLPADVRVSGCN